MVLSKFHVSSRTFQVKTAGKTRESWSFLQINVIFWPIDSSCAPSHRWSGESGWALQQMANVLGLHLPHPALQHPQRLHLHLLPLLVGCEHALLQMFSSIPSAVNNSVPEFCPQDGGNEPSDAALPVFYSSRPGATYYRWPDGTALSLR